MMVLDVYWCCLIWELSSICFITFFNIWTWIFLIPIFCFNSKLVVSPKFHMEAVFVCLADHLQIYRFLCWCYFGQVATPKSCYLKACRFCLCADIENQREWFNIPPDDFRPLWKSTAVMCLQALSILNISITKIFFILFRDPHIFYNSDVSYALIIYDCSFMLLNGYDIKLVNESISLTLSIFHECTVCVPASYL